MRQRLIVIFSILLAIAGCSEGTEQAGPPRRRPPPIPTEAGATEPPRFTTPPAPTRTPGRVIPTSSASWADGLPALIVSNGSDVNRYRRGAPTLMARVDGSARIAYASGASTVIVQREFDRGKRSQLVEVRRARTAETLDVGRAPYVSLMDVATIDGDRSVLFTTYYAAAADRGDTSGYVYIQDIQRARRHRVTEASGPEYGVTRATFGGDVIAVSAWADLTEVFQFFHPDGTEVKDPPSPTEKLPYGQPPYMTDAVLSPDGKTLAYLEGPDFDMQTQKEAGDWVLVVRDQTNGREIHRVKVADGDICIPWLDYDGRWIIISRAEWSRNEAEACFGADTEARSVSVIDSRGDRLEIVELTDVVGVATIDD